MKIVSRADIPVVDRPDGSTVAYYMFDDYEIMHTVIGPHTIQPWHHHEVIGETIYVVSGAVTFLWRDETTGEEHKRLLQPGDLVESERTVHTYANESDEPAVTLCLKRMPQASNHHETFKNDKVLD